VVVKESSEKCSTLGSCRQFALAGSCRNLKSRSHDTLEDPDVSFNHVYLEVLFTQIAEYFESIRQ
jgi:hypothetical protein